MSNIIIKSLSLFKLSSDESIGNIKDHHTLIIDENNNPVAALISAKEYNQYIEYLEEKESSASNHIYSGFPENLNDWNI